MTDWQPPAEPRKPDAGIALLVQLMELQEELAKLRRATGFGSLCLFVIAVELLLR